MHTVVVADDLLIRLHTQVGASLKIGDSTFRIAAILVREPDRMSSGMGLGPRVMMTQSALEKSGLLQQGSRSGERFLFKLSPNSGNIATVRARLEQVLPDAQVTDFRESNPALTDGLKRSTGLLSLICLVAMVLGAIGVAMAMRAHLQQRVEVLAIMKSIGARSSDILRIYLFQTVLLGLVGGLIGVVSGPGRGVDFPQPAGAVLAHASGSSASLAFRAGGAGHRHSDHRPFLPAAAAADPFRPAQPGAAQNGGGAKRAAQLVDASAPEQGAMDHCHRHPAGAWAALPRRSPIRSWSGAGLPELCAPCWWSSSACRR